MNPISPATTPAEKSNATGTTPSIWSGRVVTMALSTVGLCAGAALSATGAGAFVGAPLLAASLSAGVDAYRKSDADYSASGSFKAAGVGALVVATAGTVTLVAAPIVGAGVAAVAGGAAGGASNHALNHVLTGDSKGSYIKSTLIGGVTGGVAHGIGSVFEGIKEGASGLRRAIVVPAVGGAASGGAKVVENIIERKAVTENVLDSVASGAIVASAIDVAAQYKQPSPASTPTSRAAQEERVRAARELQNRLDNPMNMWAEGGPTTIEQALKAYMKQKLPPTKKFDPSVISKENIKNILERYKGQLNADRAVQQGQNSAISNTAEKPNPSLRPYAIRPTFVESREPSQTDSVNTEEMTSLVCRNYSVSVEEINQFACFAINPILYVDGFLSALGDDLHNFADRITNSRLPRCYEIDGKQVNDTNAKWKETLADAFTEGKRIRFKHENQIFVIQKCPEFDFEEFLQHESMKLKNILESALMMQPQREVKNSDSSDYPDDEP